MIEVYTDGSCKNNPGFGSYGYIVYKDNVFNISYLQYINEITTNNIMELNGMLHALKFLYNNNLYNENCKIFTDSQYVNNGLTIWINTWIKNDWKTSDQKPVLNKAIWEELLEIYNKFTNLKIEWIRAHTNNKDIHSLRNSAVDNLIR